MGFRRIALLGAGVVPALMVLGGASAALAADPVCLASHPTTATITYGGKIAPYDTRIEQIIPGYCVRFDYGGNALWTRTNGGGITCNGNQVQVDYGTANGAFNSFRMKNYAPAACGPAQSPPPGAPPELKAGGRVNMYYGTMIEMYSSPVMGVSAACYKIDYGGNAMWFPKSALGYRTAMQGNPVGLDYNARRNSAC